MVGHAEIARDQPTVTPRRPLIDTLNVIGNYNNFKRNHMKIPFEIFGTQRKQKLMYYQTQCQQGPGNPSNWVPEKLPYMI